MKLKRSARTRGIGSLLAVAAFASVIAPTGASAAFHLVKVTEVFPGTGASPDSAFIEIQAFQAGQNFLAAHTFKTYNAAGAELGTFTIPANVPNAQSQRTALYSDTNPPDSVAPDGVFMDLDGKINPAGGAVCFEAIDCVAWGSFAAPAMLPSPAGAPIAPGGIPDGASISRSIARGCATLLEDTDDTNDTGADFGLTANPTPRPNSVSPPEQACSAGGGAAPKTVIDRGPKKRTSKSKATFKFSSPDAGVTFECQLDKQPFKACTSAQTYKNLKTGKHSFSVRAVLGGAVDASPAKYGWKVTKRG